jgi:hypothetical protein
MTETGELCDPLETRLRGAFSPRDPDHTYVSRLYGEFAQQPRPRPRVTRNPWVRLAAAIGGMVSLASVLLLIVRLHPALIRRQA